MIAAASKDEIGYELLQDDVWVAGASGENSLQEIMHYARMYEQDGPVEIFRVVRRSIYKTEEKNDSPT